MLEGWLEWHRTTLLWKCAGLTGEQLARQSVPPSSLSLLGLVRHLAGAERLWFRRAFRGEQLPPMYPHEDPDFEPVFDGVKAAGAEADFARLAEECELARRAAAGASLDDQFSVASLGEMFSGERWRHLSLRWAYNHMIEEYARHNGHADLLRECIDGTIGA
jgi:hypothetical protein